MTSAADRWKTVAFSLIVLQLVLQLTLPAAQARMVSTDAWQSVAEASDARTRIDELLTREDVGEVLASHGISPAEAKARIDALSDEEVRRLAAQIDELPAGGNAVGAIIGAVVIVFLVLLITDILGFTHVFPFVNRVR